MSLGLRRIAPWGSHPRARPSWLPGLLVSLGGSHVVVTMVSNLSWSSAPSSTTPLRIESSSLSSPVAEGQTLDLNCVITSPAQATVTWYKRGGSLPAKHQVGDTKGDVPGEGGWG